LETGYWNRGKKSGEQGDWKQETGIRGKNQGKGIRGTEDWNQGKEIRGLESGEKQKTGNRGLE